jgi:hypothetical protein
MNETRTSWNRMAQPLRLWRLRLSLTVSKRRLQSWKSRLLPLLQAIRLDLGAKQDSLQPQRVLRLLHLPKALQLAPETLSWALVTLEDLYLLMLEQEKAMEQLLSTYRRR